ncbi:MAG TPA: protein kinase [Terriglobales bacterium]|nr:protein kinase [Terriglobales bacterium]
MATPSHPSGRIISHYRVISQIGSGGMGVVYKAEDLKLGRHVALKFLPEELVNDAQALSRFRREARAASALSHSSICTIYEIDEADGQNFIAMELLEGQSLDRLINGAPLPIERVLDLGIQVAEALDAAHRQGLIHRDIKPANVFVTRQDQAKLLDFGLAKLTPQQSGGGHSSTPTVSVQNTLSTPGTVVGTPMYMSPEQVRGEELDSRTDLFSFGMVLYEMATGARPFSGATSGAMTDAILHTTPPAPVRLNPKVPAELEHVISKALEKDRKMRYQSAADIRADLARLKRNSGMEQHVLPRTATVRKRALGTPLALFVLVALAAVIAVFFANPGQWRERFFGASGPPVHTLAVLPLQNLSGDPAQEYFADGMTEALTTDLARSESLQVISRSSSMGYKNTNKALPVIARELHADAVIEGSVQRSGNRVRVTAQLIRASTDKHLWAGTFERDFHDILALQDDVAAAIAGQVQARMGGPTPLALAKAPAVAPEAYETYLKANSYLDQFDLQKSIDYYNQTIKLDPNYAPAYAHMARAYFFLGFFSAIPPKQAWGKVKELALLATEKDDRLPEAHGALALAKLHYDWDFAGAEQEFRRALELNPSDADIRHDYAHYLMAMGRMVESAEQSRVAVKLDPVDDGLTDCLCWHSFAARQYDDSIQMAKSLLARAPEDMWEWAILGWDYEQKGRHDDAIANFKKAVELTSKNAPFLTSFFLAGLGHAYAVGGKRKAAETVLQDLLERNKQSYVSPYDIALIYTGLGDKGAALVWMTKAVAERSTWLVYSKWEPRLDPLRNDARFQDLLRRIGLPA